MQRDRKVQRPAIPTSRKRNPVDQLLNKIKHLQKTATRCETSARNDLAAVLVACVRLWARHHETAS